MKYLGRYGSTLRLDLKGAYASRNPVVRWIFHERLRKIHTSIVEDSFHKGSVLDAGCGCGVFLPTLSKTFDEVYALDLPSRMDALEPIISEILDESCSNVFLVRGNISGLSKIFPRNFFDCIVCADVLEHLAVPEEALLQFRRCLKPGGFLGFSVPTETRIYRFLRIVAQYPKPTHCAHYDFRLLLREVQKVFEITEMERIPPLLSLFVCGGAKAR